MFRELALAAKVYHERDELPSLMRYMQCTYLQKKNKKKNVVSWYHEYVAYLLPWFSRGSLIQNKVISGGQISLQAFQCWPIISLCVRIFLNVCRLNNTGWEIPGPDSDFFCNKDPVHDTVRSTCGKKSSQDNRAGDIWADRSASCWRIGSYWSTCNYLWHKTN
jgi:hypothetical protein